MAEVERVEERSHITGAFASFTNKFGNPLVSSTRLAKSVRVILKEADIARHEHAMLLN